MPVGIALQPVITVFFERLVERRKSGESGESGTSALIACMAKLLEVVFGILSHGAPFSATPDRWLREQRTAARRNPDENARLIDRALAIGRDCAERLARAELPENPDELLFDERGLPHDAGR